jgi:hypothetical protein
VIRLGLTYHCGPLTWLGLTRYYRGALRRSGLRTLRTTTGKVGRDRYVLKWIKQRPYVYLRQYQGAVGHGRPRLRDVYLGPIAVKLAREGTPAQLSAAAYRLRKARDRRN